MHYWLPSWGHFALLLSLFWVTLLWGVTCIVFVLGLGLLGDKKRVKEEPEEPDIKMLY